MISLVLLLAGCAQRDGGIGVDAITNIADQDFFVIEGTATASDQWIAPVSNGLGRSLQVGRAAGFAAASLIRFDLVDALPDSFELESARYRLSTGRIWPEGGSPDLRFVVKEITEEWEERELIPDTLQLVHEYPALDSQRVAAFTDSSFSYPLPEGLFERWVAGDSTSFGLYFEPLNDGVMIEFYSTEGGTNLEGAETIPLLEITGLRWDLNEDSLWIESELDTVIFATEDAYTTIDLSEPSPGRVHVSAGYPQRALFYFPLDSLEEHSSRLVTHAEMWLYADTLDADAMGYLGVNMTFKDASIATPAWVENPDSIASLALRYVAVNSTLFDSTNSLLRFDVSGIVAGWLAGTTENGGLQVQAGGEDQNLSRQVFHTHDTETPENRPRLVIWHVEPSN